MERSYCTVEPPDIIIWALVGRVSGDDMRRLYAEQVAFSRGKHEIYVIADLQRMEHVEAAARHVAAHAPDVDGKAMTVGGMAVVGGSFHLRMLAKMANKAAALLKRNSESPVAFFTTYDEARQWFTEIRRTKARHGST